MSRAVVHMRHVVFQPTPSARRVTHHCHRQYRTRFAFQPTPSARRVTVYDSSPSPFVVKFQPTPSARRVTSAYRNCWGKRRHISTHTLRKEGDVENLPLIIDAALISTHTLRKEGDCICRATSGMALSFQPTPSARRVTKPS